MFHIARTESGVNNFCKSTLVARPSSQTIDCQTPLNRPEAATHTDAPTDAEEDSSDTEREMIDDHTQTPQRITRTKNKMAKNTNTHENQRRYVPKRNHDIYMHVPSSRITEGAIRSYLQDIDVTDIIRVSKLSKEGYESEFRIIIGDASISDTVYGRRKFRKDTRLMPFKRYRANMRAPIHHHKRAEDTCGNDSNISKHEVKTPRDNNTHRHKEHGKADNVLTHSQRSTFQTKEPLLPYPLPTHTQSSLHSLDVPDQSTSNHPSQFQDRSYPVPPAPASNVTYQSYLNTTSPHEHARYTDARNHMTYHQDPPRHYSGREDSPSQMHQQHGELHDRYIKHGDDTIYNQPQLRQYANIPYTPAHNQQPVIYYTPPAANYAQPPSQHSNVYMNQLPYQTTLPVNNGYLNQQVAAPTGRNTADRSNSTAVRSQQA